MSVLQEAQEALLDWWNRRAALWRDTLTFPGCGGMISLEYDKSDPDLPVRLSLTGFHGRDDISFWVAYDDVKLVRDWLNHKCRDLP